MIKRGLLYQPHFIVYFQSHVELMKDQPRSGEITSLFRHYGALNGVGYIVVMPQGRIHLKHSAKKLCDISSISLSDGSNNENLT